MAHVLTFSYVVGVLVDTYGTLEQERGFHEDEIGAAEAYARKLAGRPENLGRAIRFIDNREGSDIRDVGLFEPALA